MLRYNELKNFNDNCNFNLTTYNNYLKRVLQFDNIDD